MNSNGTIETNAAELTPGGKLMAAPSTSEAEFNFDALVERVAMGKLKEGGMALEKCNLNAGKLVSSCLSRYRDNFPSIYRKGQQVSSEAYEKIQAAVGRWITGKLASVITAENSVRTTKSFVYRKPKISGEDDPAKRWVVKINTEGEEHPDLKAQKLAATLEIGRQQRRLKDLAKRNQLTDEIEANINAKIAEQQQEVSWLEKEIASQATLS
jgi:HAMP domain-containing protein